MNERTEHKGECLCGHVKVTASEVNLDFGVCHCNICRKWGSGPFFGVDCGSNVAYEGADYIGYFDSSEWAERGFCKNCGTHLFYRLKANGQHIVPIDLFDELKDLVFDHQIFIDKKPHYYDFANVTQNMTEAEVFAYFAQQQE